jgi:hypothetical protein
MRKYSVNEFGDTITNQILKNNLDLENLDRLLKIYITVKLSNKNNEDADILMNYIIGLYCMACKHGKTQMLNQILKYKTITANMPRHDILYGIVLSIHVKTVAYFANFVRLVNTFQIIEDEVHGITFNLLQYCAMCDNVDAFHYIMEKYAINLNEISQLQKEMLMDTIMFNTSRYVLKYLYESGKIITDDINKVPSNFIENKIFLRELIIKYNYHVSEHLRQTLINNTSRPYQPPKSRNHYYNYKNKFIVSNNKKQYNRSDNSNWRQNWNY